MQNKIIKTKQNKNTSLANVQNIIYNGKACGAKFSHKQKR